MSVTRLESAPNRALRDISQSAAITFGTSVPFELEAVGFCSIGFADIPVLGCLGHFRSKDINAMIPIARQHIMRAASERGMPIYALGLQVHVGIESRERMFTDQNEGSSTTGKRKRGAVVRIHLEIADRSLVTVFSAAFRRVYL